jgi:hypothetical protein
MDILDIRGQRCTDCYAAWFVSTGSYHNHLDWHFSSQCSTPYLTFDTGAVANEENFGYYEHPNPAFTCVSSQDSTTNYWVKQEFDCSSIGGCGGYGSCTANDVCTCDSGYTGTNCQSWKCYSQDNTASTVCGGHGNCTNINTCECSTGFSGSQCDTFTCNGIGSNSGSVCNGHGACISVDNCDCADGFSGNNCEYTSCFGVTSNGATVCSGHGVCTGHDICNCTTGYTGSNCEEPICFEIQASSVTVCSGNGECLSPNTCTCNSTHTGQQCQYPYCNGIESTAVGVCNGHGNCTEVDVCSCDSGYSGIFCDSPTCGGVPESDSSVCSGNGVCNGPDDCSCNDGFEGTNCESTTPVASSPQSPQPSPQPSPQDSPVSSPVPSPTPEASPSVSPVPSPLVGESSPVPVASSSPPVSMITCYGKQIDAVDVCSGHGACVDQNVCSCFSGYTGTECNSNVSNPTINVTISSNNIVGTIFNRVSSLKAEAHISPVSMIDQMTMNWQLFTGGNLVTNFADMLTVPNVQSRTISLKQNVLTSGTVYSLVFRVKFNSDANYTTQAMRIETSTPPIAGNFTFWPSTGIALTTAFNLGVSGWKSQDNSKLVYSFGYIDSFNNEFILKSFGSEQYLNTTLSAGQLTLFITAKTVYGDELRVTRTIAVDDIPDDQISNTLTQETSSLQLLNGTEFESKVAVLSSSISNYASKVNSTKVTTIINDLVDVFSSKASAANSDIQLQKKVQTIQSLTSHNTLLSKSAASVSANFLIKTFKINYPSDDFYQSLSDARKATTNVAVPLNSDESSTEDKTALDTLIQGVSAKTRPNLVDEQSQSDSMNNAEIVVIREPRSKPKPQIKMNVPRRTTSRSLNAQQIEVDIAPSVYNHPDMTSSGSLIAQSTAYKNPLKMEVDNRVAPVVTVQVFNDQNQELFEFASETGTLFTSVLPVTIPKNATTQYTCRYWNIETSQWVNDTSICSTVSDDGFSVTCQCTQPVTHSATLDYVQAVVDEEPEGEPPKPSNRKLSNGAIIGIAVGGASPFILIVVIIIVFVIPYLIIRKKKGNDNDLEMVVQNGINAQEEGI